MNETYIGWDGKEYPWPPPEGWHEAIDGRWWAPGTGPNPPPQGAGTAAAADAQAAGSGPIAGGAAAGAAGVAHDHSQTSQLPTFEPGQTVAAGHGDPTAAFGNEGIGSPTLQQPGSGGPTPTPDTYNYGFEGGPGVSPTANPDFQPARRGGGFLQAALIVFGMVAVALIGGLGYFYFTSDRGDSTEATDSTDTTADSTDTSTEGTDTTDPAADDTDDTTDDGDPADEDVTGEDDDEQDEETSTTVAVGNDQLAQFRMILNDNGLTSNNLADDAINSFAESFCGMAREAADEAAFDDTRESSVASTQSGLSDDELRLVINAAVISFCPDEADRLNIEL